ncbi:MAG: translation initiation factor [Candidatus Woesearchaeota archaeon]|nr:translation initiation factor [Candidatus Woesearchaeota archaeon]MDI3544248.1 translation initiation factor [Candidatus Woesearchaeota archaeon]MDK2907866.1 translation initiation factor [Candidatus Woesearchaeota archaeon]
MVETKPMPISSIKKGGFVVLDGQPCRVVDIQISRPGKHGHAKVRMTGVGLLDEKKRVIVMPGHDNIEVPIIEKKNAQVLSVLGNTANVMDLDSYETFDLEIPEELKEECTDGVVVLYWDIMGTKVMKQIKTNP